MWIKKNKISSSNQTRFAAEVFRCPESIQVFLTRSFGGTAEYYLKIDFANIFPTLK